MYWVDLIHDHLYLKGWIAAHEMDDRFQEEPKGRLREWGHFPKILIIRGNPRYYRGIINYSGFILHLHIFIGEVVWELMITDWPAKSEKAGPLLTLPLSILTDSVIRLSASPGWYRHDRCGLCLSSLGEWKHHHYEWKHLFWLSIAGFLYSARLPYFPSCRRREPSRRGCHPNTSVTMKQSIWRSSHGDTGFIIY